MYDLFFLPATRAEKKAKKIFRLARTVEGLLTLSLTKTQDAIFFGAPPESKGKHNTSVYGFFGF